MAEGTPSPKRARNDANVRNDSDSGEDAIGPMPASKENLEVKNSKRRVLEFEKVYLESVPTANMYERSYMHRDVVSHIKVTKTDFIITASVDGHVKFWKKQEEGIEFVKHFRAHLGTIECVSVSVDGLLMCTISSDKSLKVFDVINFDMITMIKLGYIPGCCEWIYPPGAAVAAVAVSLKEESTVHVYDGRGDSQPLHVFATLHSKPCTFIKYNHVFDTVVSGDTNYMIEYWAGPTGDYTFPSGVDFEFKTDTDLYEFAKNKAIPFMLSFSPDGKQFVVMASDRKVRVFRFLTGKLYRVFDEMLSVYSETQKANAHLPQMDFSRRMAQEKDLDKNVTEGLKFVNAVFDESGNFILYPTMLGIKVVNVYTCKCIRMLAKEETIRFLQLALYQGRSAKTVATLTLEMQVSDNPGLQLAHPDPTLFCTALKKNRFYLLTQREPEENNKTGENERDVFNEKPSKEEQMAATQASTERRVGDSVVIHTTMGDIHIRLFPKECPKTVENFCVHSRNGYYNGHMFHRIIKGFMIQTGDPLANGTGGESIWSGEFEDEFDRNLRHDRPYTVSMANAGPNTNGSQFFITVCPTPWLDNKHTVFGRVTKGMEVVHTISQVKTNPRNDKPFEDVKIVSIIVK
ncbi:peptidylprolyl isomerase domain and WD repeat-containing protein 1-like [Corticium candelabrum]|uniref:peptidylprolyl isomerase domain and WD repeat-containing protein 1-like n=1 Tax=Corticium candelabrum TaxID=121492 RepID=UPI002E26668A|nr:peptidylprolyl isomerase domain and WD repeat-containing protein 1-like [Corticium candelabrum]